MAIRKGETRIFGAASGRELEETHRTASVEGDVGEVVQVAQRIRGVEEAHQRECVRLAQLGCTPQPVQAPRDVALARALVSEQVHRTDSAHCEPVPGRSFVDHGRSRPDHVIRAVERLEPGEALCRITPALPATVETSVHLERH